MDNKMVRLNEDILFDLQGSFNDTITFLRTLEHKYNQRGYFNLKLIVEGDYDGVSLAVFGEKLETDKAFEKRRSQREDKKRIGIGKVNEKTP